MTATPDLAELLAGRYIATLATSNEDGSIHQAAVWFLHRDGSVLVATGGSTRKARNARRRPAGAILIDARGPGPLRGAAATGALDVLEGEAARRANELVWSKYLTPAGLEEPAVGGAIRAHDDVTIVLRPDAWRTWATDADFGGSLEQPGIAFPLDT
jgi:general stress protein 26